MKTNTAATPDKTHITHEGAPAKRITVEWQLRRSVMACLLWEDEFYEDGESIAKRIHEAAALCSPEFVSALAIEARQEHGLRHAPLWLTLDLVRRGGKIAGDTIARVIRRADELTELVAMYWKPKRRPLSAQMKRSLAEAFVKFDGYQLAKYDRANAVRLRDVLFLTHAKPKDENQAAIWRALVDNKLAVPDTWEVALSSGADKKETFERLIAEKKLGGLAFLRNLRNMVTAGVSEATLRAAFEREFTGILPHQFIAAAKHCPALEPEIDAAMFRALAGMPQLPGKTVLLVDVSGSMDVPLSGRGEMRRLEAASAVAILLAGIAEELEVYSFSHSVVRVPARQGMALAEAIIGSQPHGGTYLGAAVEKLRSDARLIVITDEQSHDQVGAPQGRGYMINVASNKNGVGYGKWTHIDGFSAQCVRYIQALEELTTV